MKRAFGFAPVTEADFDELLALRIATMRESQRHGIVKISEDE